MEISPYLFFNGDCEAAFKFYEKCLGGHIDAMLTHEGTPAEKEVPANWLKKILHAHMTIGGTALMASDAPPGRQSDKPAGFSVCVNIDEPAAAERAFRAMSEGGTVTMPIQQTFWAKRFGMLVDRFGVPWMINCAPES